MRNRTSAQKKRDLERQKSIRKQQSKGIRDVNTDRYNNWGLPRGASPPTRGSGDPEPCGTSVTVARRYVEEIVSRFGQYDGKAWGFTVRQFPMYAVEKRRGEWRVTPLVFSIKRSHDSILYRASHRGVNSRTEPRELCLCGPTVAVTETKKAALEMLNASGSRRMQDRRGKTPYLVCGDHVEDDHEMSFKLTRKEWERIDEMNRSGGIGRVDDNIHGPNGKVPERVL